MIQPSDTPPDGDFARYVERLTASNAAAGAQGREDILKSRKEGGQGGTPVAASPAIVLPRESLKPFAGIAFLTHLKWLVAAWIGTQLLGSFVSWAGFLFIPIFLAYVAWVIFNVNRDTSGALVTRLRELMAHAAEEARKAQNTGSKRSK